MKGCIYIIAETTFEGTSTNLSRTTGFTERNLLLLEAFYDRGVINCKDLMHCSRLDLLDLCAMKMRNGLITNNTFL